MLTVHELQAAADELCVAQADRVAVAPLSKRWPEMEASDAYAIQRLGVRRRVEGGARIRGHRVERVAMGREDMGGFGELAEGHLLDDMFLFEQSSSDSAQYCQPRVQAGMAFVLGRKLSGQSTVADVMRATEYLVPCLEIVDSRIRDWNVKLEDAIADNAFAAGLVLGGRAVMPKTIDPRMVGMVLRRNGQIVDTGCSGGVLGNPVSAVAWIANKVAELGSELEEGQVIVSGSGMRAHEVQAGDAVRVEFDELGDVEISFA